MVLYIHKKDIYSYTILFFLMTSIFLPSIHLFGINLYLTTIFSFILLLFIFFERVVFSKYIVNIFLMGVCVFISSIYSEAIGLTSFSSRNYIEAVKYLQYIPYLMSLSFFYLLGDDVFKKILNYITLFFIFVFAIQWFNFFGLKPILINMYLDPESPHFNGVLEGWRLTLTGSGPNEGAAIAAFLLIYNFSIYLKSKKIYYIFTILGLILAMLMSQSRTSLIGSFFVLTLILFFDKNINLVYKFLFFVFVFVFVFVVFFYFNFEYIKVGFELAYSGDNNSLNLRYENLYNGLKHFYESPIVGIGPAKNELSTIIDSEYILILQRYGIFGVFVFSFFIFRLIYNSFKERNLLSSKILLGYTIFTLFIMLTNNAYSGYQLMSITIFLIIWNFSSKGTSNDRSFNISSSTK
ncbi:O-antigen ligase family protein [Acinetobacter baumannii]|uniref:O-antigen ligase family protein n=1 Tax=Acinetobacter baumannii TaxID=470 RepID=UPI0018FFE093|nr:O-antigen ligase family protein [Acinetobacter baumannii]MBJ9580246.1 O-antigen ligase family protein [Acinetobacter baumannii]MDC4973410.1 O-antigen ligase family protein [Acinetobacter baumannii]MDH2614866.1 O-antigen ligase family protein [Acinetobacter baumannii]MDH2618375.1 O-antigen ligase family protein [Acinetobacter baumannii]WPD29320.1 O-antigen ligase family protein [Acinetobacter baumannii]